MFGSCTLNTSRKNWMASLNLCLPLYAHPLAIRKWAKAPCSGTWRPLTLMVSLLVLGSATHAEQTGSVASTKTVAAAVSAAPTARESRIWMTVGERRFGITLTPSPAARALLAQLPLTLNMEDLNSNEKHAELPKPLPTQAMPAGTIRSGDFMLYGATTLVVFYAGLNSSYAYTRLGRIDDADGLQAALGKRAVRITFTPQ